MFSPTRPGCARSPQRLAGIARLLLTGALLAVLLPAAAQDPSPSTAPVAPAVDTTAKPNQAAGVRGVGAPPEANLRAREERRHQSQRVWRSDRVAAGVSDEARDWSKAATLIDEGRALYLEGRRAGGAPLVGLRLDGQVTIRGAAAACVLCHRRSGLGAVEGANQIQPITGRYLFDQDRRAIVNMSIRARKSFNLRHEPYTLPRLTEAIRDGRSMTGRTLDPLMPRYDLSEREVLALASYLRTLSNDWSAGVEDRMLHFATVITPDADPQRRRIFLDTVQAIVAQKNGNIVTGQRSMSSAAEMAMQTDRRWELHVWELSGPSATWGAQLDRLLAEQPVFAIASGLGNGEWAPVHRFCERQALPCWFPSVAAVPTESEGDFYSLYFSRGVGLEADVLARLLTHRTPPIGSTPPHHADGAAASMSATHAHAAASAAPMSLPPQLARPRRVLQVWRDDGVAESAVHPLHQQLGDAGLPAQELRVTAQDPQGLTAALAPTLAALGEDDAVVLWLDRPALLALATLPVPRGPVYLSAGLSTAEQLQLPTGWREKVQIVYPYQLPSLRQRGLTYFREWLKIRQLPMQDEVLQSEVYFAFSYLNDTVVDMLDNLHRDYLVERGENMLSQREAARTEDEARELIAPKTHLVDAKAQPMRNIASRPTIPRAVPRPATLTQALPAMAQATGAYKPAETGNVPFGVVTPAQPTPTMLLEQSKEGGASSATSGAPESTNVYPRLSLAQFQRHASKGAYLVGLDPLAPGGVRKLAEWLVP